nr:autophagy protein atg9 [Polyrhizophydium stewartii]
MPPPQPTHLLFTPQLHQPLLPPDASADGDASHAIAMGGGARHPGPGSDADPDTSGVMEVEDADAGDSDSEGEAPASIQFEMPLLGNGAREPERQHVVAAATSAAAAAISAAALPLLSRAGLGVGRSGGSGGGGGRAASPGGMQHSPFLQQGNLRSAMGQRRPDGILRGTNAGANAGRDQMRIGAYGQQQQQHIAPPAPRLSGPQQPSMPPPQRRGSGSGITSWRDVRHLDLFLTRIYQYFVGKGYFCIMLSTAANLATGAFVIFVSTFLVACIDYQLIHEKKRLADVIEPNCVGGMSWLTLLVVSVFTVMWLLQAVRFVLDLGQLREMQFFFTNVLDITDDKLQNTLWSDVVDRIVESREAHARAHPSALLRRLDAHTIANRILRKDNYLIALFNRDILDLRVPLMGQRQIMSKLMEWNLSYCIFSYVFDDRGLFHKRFLKENNRLQKRFRTMAFVNLVFSPFLLIFLILYLTFKYAQEYQRNPAGASARQYSPFAWWKFREFNELPHLLKMRLNRSSDNANTYLRQFPKEYIIILAKFVAFVSGSLLTVLLALTLFEEELQQGFEITPGRSAFFYIGVLGTILALSRTLVPPENEVFEPEKWMREVALETHYLPDEWRDRAHTEDVRAEFERLFELRLLLSLQELLSIVFAPIILYYSLPPCAPAIIDFFREFTVHVDSLGYVCSFAVFDFKRHGNIKFDAQPQAGGGAAAAPHEHLVSRQGKMEMSFVNFKANNPNWDPGLEGSEYLSRILARRRERGFGRPGPLGQTVASLHAGTASHHSPYSHLNHQQQQTQHQQPQQPQQSYAGQQRHDFMASTTMDADSLTGHAQANQHARNMALTQPDLMESYLRGESVMQSSQIDGRVVARELVGLLDAIYEANRRTT